MSRSEDDRERVKAHLQSLSESLPSLIEQVRGISEANGRPIPVALPDAEKEQQRLIGFAAYLEQYGRPEAATRGPISVADAVAEAVALAGGEVGMKATVGVKYLPAPLVYANPRQLGQVFVSLMINAAQAMPAGAAEVNRVDLEVSTSAAGWARISIADTGSGIAEDVLPHVFEPMYSTKRGAGMGIGLAVVREIITRLGGKISVASEVGRGTTFVIELPPTP